MLQYCHRLVAGDQDRIEDSLMPGYQALTPTQCKVLFGIWQLTPKLEQEGQAITAKVLAEALRMEVKHVQTVVRSIQRISVDYIITAPYFPPDRRGKRGHPVDSYHLNRERLATLPEVALVLLELLKFQREKRELVNRSLFVKHLVDRCHLEESLVQAAIDKSIETSYLVGLYQGYISPGERLICEKEYLELIAVRLAASVEGRPP